MDVLKIYCLGDLQLFLGDELVSKRLSLKARSLLCYLAITQEPHARWALANLLWGETSEERARNSLRVALSELRKCVASHLAVTRQAIALNQAAPYWVDAQILQHQVSSGANPETLGEALKLYRGDFLTGVAYKDAPAFDDWVTLQRQRFREMVTQAQFQLAGHCLQEAAYPEGIKLLEDLLALEPWHEAAHRRLMLLLARNGQRAAALRHYATCKQALRNELDASPSSETTDLYQRIKAAERSTRYTLPQPPTPFVGRQQELATLSKNLEHPDCRLLTLVGPGGIGKTRLALEAASAKRHRFLEGVYFVALAGVDSPELILQLMMDTLAVSLGEGGYALTQLTKYLKNREILFVIDNFEHLMPGASLLSDLLSQTTHVKFLVTSRERLNLQHEWVLEVFGLDFPAASQDPSTADHSAVKLFFNEMSRLNSAPLQDDERPVVSRICRLLEGMPLGIELAAGMTHVLPLRAIAQRLEENMDVLATSQQDVPERHRSLEAVFAHSWQTLSPDEKDAFMRLSVFRGGFDLAAAEQVAKLKLATLEGLMKKSFIHRQATGRYYIHEFLRLAGEKKASETTDFAALKNAHLDYFLDLAGRVQSELARPNAPWPLELKLEANNFQAAIRWALESQNPEKFLRVAKTLWRFYDQLGQWQTGERHVQRALSVCPDGEPETQAELLCGLAQLSWKQGKYAQAQEASEQSRSLFKQLNDRQGVVAALQTLARVAHYQGDYEEANAFYQEALAQLEALDDQHGVATVLCDLGRLAYYQGNLDLALTQLGKGLQISRRLKDKRGIAYNLLFYAEVVFAQGDLHRAINMVEKSLYYSKNISDFRTRTIAFNLLGAFYCHLRNYQRAQRALEESLSLSKESGDMRAQALSLSLFGFLHHGQGNVAEAKQSFQNSLTLRVELQDRRGIAECFEGLALAVARSNPQAAATLLGISEQLAQAIGANLDLYDYGIGLSTAPLKKKLRNPPHDLDWAKGAKMSLDEALVYALDGL